jgi:pterin-4a-carbinolamine dehydratase
MATQHHQATSTIAHGWRQEGSARVRELRFRDFDEALGFVEAIGRAAADHLRRPDMCILDFNHVRLRVASRRHDGVITLAEVHLMQRVDAVVEQLTAHA